MIAEKEYREAQKKALQYFHKAGILITEKESANIEVADFGLGALSETGLELLVYVNTDRVCAKELWASFRTRRVRNIFIPRQETSREKEETFRCRWGKSLSLRPRRKNAASQSEDSERKEREVYRLARNRAEPGRPIHFASGHAALVSIGCEGCVVFEFSTRRTHEADVFTDPDIQRATKLKKA